MKPIYNTLLTSGVVATLTACSGLRLSGDYALSDDVYYDNAATRAVATAPAAQPAVSQSDIDSYDRRVAAYSTGGGAPTADDRDFSQIQRYYSNANATNGAAADTAATQTANSVKVTEVSPDNPDSGYWLDGFNGSEADQSYAERIIKFHRPIVSVNYYSPFFDCARYSGDWNIYIDGYGSAYFVPTWSNPWYSDYYYGGLAYDWRWRRLGWHLGWGWGFGWASGWGYYDWAWGGWGWPYYHHPYHYGWWGAPHHPYHWAPGGGWDAPRRPVYASRAGVMPQTHSGSRQDGRTTTNPNASRAAQLYQNSYATPARASRSYTRNTDGSSTLPNRNSAYGTNTRRTDASGTATGTASSGTTSRTQSTYSTNTRRNTSAINGSSSRASYTPTNGRVSRSSTTTSVNRGTTSTYSSNVRRSTSTSTYTPSTTQRQSGSSSTYTPRGTSRQAGSYSGGATNIRRTAPASSFSGASRSAGSSYSGVPRSSGGGGGAARTARPR